MDFVAGLECTICGSRYQASETAYVCPRHGNEGVLDVVYHYDLIGKQASRKKLAVNRDASMWRYLDLLPVAHDASRQIVAETIIGCVGWTPLVNAARLASTLGLKHLWVKDDGRQPTASLKDRASAIAVLKARELGCRMVTTASTGNAAAALAGMCTATSQPNVIFVPRSTPPGKIAQLLVFGSKVLLVDGAYDAAYELCLKAAQEFGWYNRNTGYNPYMSEGKKTAVYEICEQLHWQAPDRIFVPVGDGCILGSLHKGIKDMISLGWIDRMPRLMGVQASGSAALADAWEQGMDGTEMAPIAAHTIADSICTGLPRDRIKALRAVRETDGAFFRVTDEEIVRAMLTLAAGCGIFAEPAAAASYAGLVKAVAQGAIGPDERVVVLATGSGLKDIAAAIRSVAQPPAVVADVADVRRAVSQMGAPAIR